MNSLEIREEESKTELLKRTICKGSTNDEMELFLHVCKRLKLDPFMKQIYPVKRWSKADNREVMSIQTSIDGFRLIAERTGHYSPGREPTFAYSEKGKIISATAYVKKKTSDGTWHEVAASAYFDEYVQKTKGGEVAQFWLKMPHVMLAKCAESIALRKAFPADLSSVYTEDEMAQANNPPESAIIEIEEPIKLTIEQKNVICDLAVQVDDMSFINRALNHYGVKRLEDINPEKFPDLVQWLTVKINAKGAPKHESKSA